MSTARVALIPGGAKGIGREIGLRLAERGWAVALCYRSSGAQAAETAAEIERRGGQALAVEADVSSFAACQALVAQVIEWRGQVDALINCAGLYHRVDILEETPEVARDVRQQPRQSVLSRPPGGWA